MCNCPSRAFWQQPPLDSSLGHSGASGTRRIQRRMTSSGGDGTNDDDRHRGRVPDPLVRVPRVRLRPWGAERGVDLGQGDSRRARGARKRRNRGASRQHGRWTNPLRRCRMARVPGTRVQLWVSAATSATSRHGSGRPDQGRGLATKAMKRLWFCIILNRHEPETNWRLTADDTRHAVHHHHAYERTMCTRCGVEYV